MKVLLCRNKESEKEIDYEDDGGPIYYSNIESNLF